jgi:hypothetical protein
VTESEAKAKANAVMSIRCSADVAPKSLDYRNVGGRRTWTFFYEGYIVTVNDKTGDVSVFEGR